MPRNEFTNSTVTTAATNGHQQQTSSPIVSTSKPGDNGVICL
jgi:hypothetical protein